MQLSNDVKNMKKNPKLLVPADKTNNLQELTTEEYNKLLIENISQTYRNSTLSAIHSLTNKAKVIAKDLNLNGRIELYNQNPYFITLKDHKEIFRTIQNAD